jgi:hypothetical protein
MLIDKTGEFQSRCKGKHRTEIYFYENCLIIFRISYLKCCTAIVLELLKIGNKRKRWCLCNIQ